MNPDETILSLAAIGLTALTGAAALYQGLAVRSYSVNTRKLNSGETIRLVAVSDLHSRRFGDDQSGILNTIALQHPDYIVLPGDIIDDRCASGDAWRFLRGVAGIAPTFYAPGNHEYCIRKMSSVLAKITRCGVTVLADRAVEMGALLIAGCEDSEKTRRLDRHYNLSRSLNENFHEVKDSRALTILLAHRPEHIGTYLSLGFDLIVSGHAHGGQVRVPYLLNGLYASGQGLFPPFPGGCYRYENTTHIVSRGVAVYRGIPRVFNPPEITVIDLRGTGGARVCGEISRQARTDAQTP